MTAKNQARNELINELEQLRESINRKEDQDQKELEAMLVPRFRTAYNYTQQPGEVFTKPSKTIPNMSMSIQEVLRRFANGQSLTRHTNLTYTGDLPVPDVEKMDLVEIQNMKDELSEFAADAKQRNKEAGKAAVEKKKAAKQLDIEEAIKAMTSHADSSNSSDEKEK